MSKPLPPPCERFFNNICQIKVHVLKALSQSQKSALIDEATVEAAFSIIGLLNRQTLLNLFITRTNQHWQLIAVSADVADVLENVLSGFAELGATMIAEILRLVKDQGIDPSIRVEVMRLAKGLVRIALRDLHATGCPTGVTIDVKHMAKIFEMTL